MKVHHLYFALHCGRVVYIGVSWNLSRRISEHKRSKNSFGEFLREQGVDVSFVTVLAGERSYIYDAEVRAVELFGTREPFGFNRAQGGIGGRDPLPSTRKKISQANKGKKLSAWHIEKWLAGAKEARKTHVISDETRAKISQAGRRRKYTEEHIRKFREARRRAPFTDSMRAKLIERNKARKGVPRSEKDRAKIAERLHVLNQSRKGVPLSDSVKAKISKAHKGRVVSDEIKARMSEAAFKVWRERRRSS